ncbi:hypothetical protein [Paracoccus laeviglucosivorans]|uniref:Clp protease n=1 Tax=Paracoccus laeviglucosivorans TaxID=1197861 RepID=A0A521FNQ7_9RHOB|nr:hypothetical protein [Paracoccus laeviglucosivorans]SMO97792.1 hypothetical protein SAMN06265221_13020 [Paracoccus laeviglucosivorans]
MLSSPSGAIKAVLLSQVLLAAAIVVIDLRSTSGGQSPELSAPAQGPSVRPYRPDQRPQMPGAPAMGPMPERLEFSQAGDEIRILGQIAPGDADRFLSWLDTTQPAQTQVSLNSSGGSVADALAIGRTIRSAGYSTRVSTGSVCMSACPYLLAAGTTRDVARGGVVGVHQHYFGKNTILPAFMAVADLQRGQASVMDYLDEMGIDLRLMSFAMRTPASEIYVLDHDLMQELRLTTRADDA